MIAFDFILDWLNKYLESFSFKTFCEKSNNFRFEKFEKFQNFKKFHIFVKNVIFWWKILIFKFSKEFGDGRHPLSLSNVPAVSLSTSSRTSSWTSNDPSYKFLSSDMAIHATGSSREPWLGCKPAKNRNFLQKAIKRFWVYFKRLVWYFKWV